MDARAGVSDARAAPHWIKIAPRGRLEPVQSQWQSEGRGHSQGHSQGQWQSQGKGNPLGVRAVPGTDLATNPPGAVCVEAARDLRTATPLRSRAERLLQVRSAENWLRGTANSERKVAADLERLGPQWRVLHSVPVGEDRPAISHLAIGPRGIFTLVSRGFRPTRPQLMTDKVEAQVMTDAIKIHGESFPYVAEARAQAWRTSRVLSAAAGHRVFVRPAVVLVGVDEVRFYDLPDRVDVLPRRQLLRWLQRFPATLSSTDVTRIYSAARCGDTWIDPTGANFT